MRVDEVVSAFLHKRGGSTQNTKSVMIGQPRGLAFVTYDEVIAAWSPGGSDLYIDDTSKYTVTSTRHRNALVTGAKLAGINYRRKTRQELRDLLGLPDRPPMAAGKLPYRDTRGGAAPMGAVQSPVAPMRKVDDPLLLVPPLNGKDVTKVEANTPAEALEALVLNADKLMGADVCVIEHLHNVKLSEVTVLDDDGNRVIVSGAGFGIGPKADGAAKKALHSALEGIGFHVPPLTAGVIENSEADAVVILASGDVEQFMSSHGVVLTPPPEKK